MLGLYAGMAEIAHAIDNWRKITMVARTVADLTSLGDKQNPISSTTMNDILASATAIMRPFSGTDLQIVVSALGVTATGASAHPTVCSSIATTNATARSIGAASDLYNPPGYSQIGNRYVLAEVSMNYAPMLGGSLIALVGGVNGHIHLSVNLPWPVRGGTAYGSNTYLEVVLPSGVRCP